MSTLELPTQTHQFDATNATVSATGRFNILAAGIGRFEIEVDFGSGDWRVFKANLVGPFAGWANTIVDGLLTGDHVFKKGEEQWAEIACSSFKIGFIMVTFHQGGGWETPSVGTFISATGGYCTGMPVVPSAFTENANWENGRL